MKRLFYLFGVMLVSVSLWAAPVSLGEARQIATLLGVECSEQQVARMRAAAAVQPAYYIFENESGEGWVMLAADDVAHPVLAYSSEGRFVQDGMPENLRHWVGRYEEHIRKAAALGLQADEEISQEWAQLREAQLTKRRAPQATVTVDALVKTKWDQDAPYWNLCPYDDASSQRAYTGCVATAMAQVMNYWQWPTKGQGSITYQPSDPNELEEDSKRFGELSANFGETTYDWDNMLDYYTKYYDEDDAKHTTTSGTAAQKLAVATLMYHAGVGAQMAYGTADDGGSGTFTGTYEEIYGYVVTEACAEYALENYFRYKSSAKFYMKDYYGTTTKWRNMLKTELDAGRPIIYDGSGDAGGHCFICDGYDSSNKFHFNWGWSGQNNGFYALTALSPGSGGAGGGDYEFTDNQGALIGIEPDYDNVPSTEEVLPTEWVANYAEANYYPEFSDKDSKQYDFSIVLYVLDDDNKTKFKADFDVILTDSTKIAGEHLPNTTYSWAGIRKSDDTYFYLAAGQYATNLGITENLAATSLNITFKQKNSSGYLEYDVVATLTATDNTVYTVTAQDLQIRAWDTYDYQNDSYFAYDLTDDQKEDETTANYNLQMYSDITLTGAVNDEVEYGVTSLSFPLKIANYGEDAYTGYFFGYVYRWNSGTEAWESVGFASVWNATLEALSAYTITCEYTAEEALPVGEYVFAMFYSPDGSEWNEFGNTYYEPEYYFSIVDVATALPVGQQTEGVYPTVTSDILNVMEEQAGDIQIYNRVGQLVKTVPTTSAHTVLNVTDLSGDMYMLRVNNKVYKFIKR